MSVGYPVTKQTLDNRAGALVETLRNTFVSVLTLKDYLDGFTVAQLVAAFPEYTTADATKLKAAIADLAALRAVAYGQATQPAASNFFFNADDLTGIV